MSQTTSTHTLWQKIYFDRYIWLIDLIQHSGHISFNDINDRWQRCSLNQSGEKLSKRTFFNHKDAILDIFGLEIKCDRSLGYYIDNQEDIKCDALKNWMMQSLSLNNMMKESAEIRDRIICENIPSCQKWQPEILRAMKDEKK